MNFLRTTDITNFQSVIWSHSERFRLRLLLLIPILNAAADSTIYYFIQPNTEGVNPGVIRGFILLIFIGFFGVKRISNTIVNKVILIFLIYLFLLTLLSSDFNTSFFNGYIKWFVPMMMLPIGYYYIRSRDSLIKLIFSFVIGAFLVCINLTIAQFTGFGISAYVDNSFYNGGAGVGITNQLAIVLLTYPILLRVWSRFSNNEKWFILITGLLSLVYLIVSMKRAGLIGLAGGGIIFFYFAPNKRKILKYAVLCIIILILTFPFYSEILIDRYNVRVEQTKMYEEEGRYREFIYVIKEFKEGNIWHKLFGSEPFNTSQFFGMKYFKRGRMIHGDFSLYLYGTGLIGITLYFSIFGTLFYQVKKYHDKIKQNSQLREIIASFIAVLFAAFLISATGSGSIGEKCLVYLYLGSVLGFLKTLTQGDRDMFKQPTEKPEIDHPV